ncbi:DUF2254 family protein [Conexibacter sp. JD483]|uniref:DUF2254 family protein n=1 Tax=unclassified Conexibacter TaxID=2627773 RepID=UPI00271A121F|nr:MULTISPECIES: DUF2254 family protein [unclassified Conexibacter]MDO8186468.1 DUF2254 family protein [Conexibacter sp. CPCC 205706]MDO8200037.1 DUF2254 family protein [Conexibacter sp. CPCC 205762]MDR9370887.1 DUF2254 family protein [Conexibacter sp. JD483]
MSRPATDPGDGGSEDVRPHRVRRLTRRSRLWWRFQLRAIRFRRPFRWFRLLRNPEPDSAIPLSRQQLWVGRRLGRAYLGIVGWRERIRIARARVPDRAKPARTVLTLLGPQRWLLFQLAFLIALGFALDLVVQRYGGRIVDWLGVEEWLRSTFSLPSVETLRNLLAAAAGGTATVLGLILSISLIAWQMTADRYRSTSIVSFLLRERMSAAVVRLLALGFAFSLWVLALLEIAGYSPYISAAMALSICTVAVLSLITYRQAGLLGYLPHNIAISLRSEIIGEIFRARRPNAGRSVEDYSRRVIAGDLQIFDEMLGRLLESGDSEDVAACLDEMRTMLSAYVRLKSGFSRQSLFFERYDQRLESNVGVDVDEAILAQGLMDPTTSVADHLWFERKVLAIVRPVLVARVLDASRVAQSLIGLWSESLQYAWLHEDPEVVDLIFAEAEAAGVHARMRTDRKVTEQFMTLPWLLVEAIGRGWHVSAKEIVAKEPWRRDAALDSLPWDAQDDAARIGLAIRRERAICDEIITPRNQMAEEVEGWRAPRLRRLQEESLRRAINFCDAQLAAALHERSEQSYVVARMSLRCILRIAHYGFTLGEMRDVAKRVLHVIDRSSPENAKDLREDAGRAARVLAAQQEWEGAYALLRTAMGGYVLARLRESDEQQAIRLTFDGLVTAATVYGWAELHNRRDQVIEVGRTIDVPFARIDGLAEAVENHGWMVDLMLPMVVYYQWMQPLTQAVQALPERPKPGSHGYMLEKDHPSSLIAQAELLFGPDECVRHLVMAVAARRASDRRRLAEVLSQVYLQRIGDA